MIFVLSGRYASDGEEQTVLESMRDYLINTIQKTFEVGLEQADRLYQELLQCTRNKNLVSKRKISIIMPRYGSKFENIPISQLCFLNKKKPFRLPSIEYKKVLKAIPKSSTISF